MNINKIVLVVVGVAVIVTAFLVIRDDKQESINQVPEESVASDLKNSIFTIDGELVALVNGVSEVPVENSASLVTTRYFGNEASGDLNGDGIPDTAFLVAQSTGGSGLFYYAVVALKTSDGYKMTNAFLVGDRIAPQSTEINAGEIYVNFAERKPGEPMTATPSVGAVLLLNVTSEGVLKGLMQ